MWLWQNPDSDAARLVAARRGDPGPLWGWLAGQRGALLRHLAHSFRDLCADDIEDAVQEASRQLVEKPPADLHGTLKSYLYEAAAHRCCDMLRHPRRARAVPLDDHNGLAARDDSAATVSLRLDAERALRALPDDLRLILLLADHQGLRGNEIAPVVGKSCSQVSRDLKRARAKARDAMAEASHAISSWAATP